MGRQEKLVEILDLLQKKSIGTNGEEIENMALAGYLIMHGVKMNPVEQGDTVYVVQKASMPCNTCEHRGDGSGFCIRDCNAAEYRVYTVIVDDVSSFCRIAPDGELVLNKNVYLTKDEAYDNLPKPCGLIKQS